MARQVCSAGLLLPCEIGWSQEEDVSLRGKLLESSGCHSKPSTSLSSRNRRDGWEVAITHWLHYQLPQERVRLADLKLSHPEVGKTRSLTFLLAWQALTTHLKIAVVHKENPAGRAITKLLTAFELKPDHQRYFVRPVSREEAEANTACASYDLRASEAAPYIPGCKVVIVTTGLVWDQKRADSFHAQHTYGKC